jgi:hypothetical protein
MGGGQAHPFVLHPPDLPWPAERPVVGSEAVHRVLRGWLAQLGETAYNDSEPPGASVSTRVAGASSAM